MIRSSLHRPAVHDASDISAPEASERAHADREAPATRDDYRAGGRAAQMGARGPVKGSASFLGAVFGFFGKVKKFARTFLLGAAVAAAGFTAGGPVAPDGLDVASLSKTAPTAVVTVKAGDSLSKIALANGVSLEAMIAANPQIENPALIHPGQQVNLPTVHTVKPGDSMSQIAIDYGVPLASLEKANQHITYSALIHPGQKIALPHTGQTAKEIAMTADDVEAMTPTTVNYTTGPVPGTNTNAAPAASIPDASTEIAEDKAVESTAEPYQAKGSVGKLIRQMNKLSFGLLEDREFDYARSWDIGESGEARITLEGVTTETAFGDRERYAYEAEQTKQGREVLWVRSEGSVAIEGAKTNDESMVAAEAEVSFEMVRPFSYHSKQPAASLGAVEAFVYNLHAMPFSHEAAAALERGSGFDLRPTRRFRRQAPYG